MNQIYEAKMIADIFNSMSEERKIIIYSIICSDEKLNNEEFFEKYKDYI